MLEKKKKKIIILINLKISRNLLRCEKKIE